MPRPQTLERKPRVCHAYSMLGTSSRDSTTILSLLPKPGTNNFEQNSQPSYELILTMVGPQRGPYTKHDEGIAL